MLMKIQSRGHRVSDNYEQVKLHYQKLLSEHYTWGFNCDNDNEYLINTELISHFVPKATDKTFVDLGCGSGFQTIPLLQLGYNVIAIDGVDTFIAELTESASARGLGKKLTTYESDMMLFPNLIQTKVDGFVCMGDSLTHLANLDEVSRLFKLAHDHLNESGVLLIQFKDLTQPLLNNDRFIPVKSDERTVFTCFLEWERGLKEEEDGSGCVIKVTDLVHVKKGIGAWELCTSWYKKLGITARSCAERAQNVGFTVTKGPSEKGMVLLCLSK
jgi:SAM-dependent methyltransferase